MRYLLDTNICIYLMKNQPESVRECFARCYTGDIVISAITLAELEYGVAVSRDKTANAKALAELLEDLLVAPFDQIAAKTYGFVRAAARKGQRDALDKLIAAHAKALDVILVTNNEKDFHGYAGLKIENWV